MGAPSTLKQVQRPLVFALNGQRVELPEVDPATTLLNYIRSETRFKGPKRGCGEGGCGACLVSLAKYNPDTKEVKERSVNACLVMLCSVDGCAITTPEGLGNQRDGFHAIQQRLSAFHGSQCGFCTPGMTMAIYGRLKHEQQRQSKATAAAANGTCSSGQATSEVMERAIQGNICRCTGYRPILDVCKSFASDVDLEDLGVNTCWASKATAKLESLPVYDPSGDPAFPQFLIEALEARESVHENGTAGRVGEEAGEGLDATFRHVESSKGGERERAWVRASSLPELSAALRVLKGRKGRVKLVVGNTSSGLYKEIAKIDVFVDISQIPELVAVRRNADSLEIGAATRISELIDYLEGYVSSSGSKNAVAEGLVDHLKKLAGGHVRNWGSVGGNLVMAQQFAFESDMATILLGAGASVKVATMSSPRHTVADQTLEEFLAQGSLGDSSVLQSVYIPLNPLARSGSPDCSNSVFKTFRGAPRPYGNAVSYANAAFLAHVSVSEGSTLIQNVRLAFGAFGTKHALRASRVEHHLKGKVLSTGLILECLELLKTEIVPAEGTTDKEFRISLTVGFLYDFLQSLLPHGSSGQPAPTPLFPHVGNQHMTMNKDYFPVSQPTAKFQSQLQASGEAVYVDDIPSPPHCLHAAFVLSSEPYAKVMSIDSEAAINSAGAVAFISASDVPPGGQNLGVTTPFFIMDEPAFADNIVGYVGDPLGLVVADTYDNAKFAAGKMRVHYDTKGVGAPILTIEDAVARNSVYTVPVSLSHPKEIGDVNKSLAEAEFRLEGTFATEEQKHFYMETQTAMAIPDEDNCITIYTSSQAIAWVQEPVAKALNIPFHNVRVITRRLGGGFGGKGSRVAKICVAVALAAYKLRRPVRISLDRNTDMQMIGGRNPTRTNFTVGFNKTGKITGLKVELFVEGGWYPDMSPLIGGSNALASLKKYDYGSFDMTITTCKTNNVPKTAVRAPGNVQGSAIADMIQDQVASYLDVHGDTVREVNLLTHKSLELYHPIIEGLHDPENYTLSAMWSRLKTRSRKDARALEIEKFNSQSRWIKRGLAMVPSVYGIHVFPMLATVSIFQDGSIVAEVGGVEMGQGLYTKVRQAIAYFLSPLWRKEDSMAMIEKIRVLQADTLSLPNTNWDGGSSTSEGAVAAAEIACAVLVQRLLPVKEQLAQGDPDGTVSWEKLCFTARQMQIDLQAHEIWASPFKEYQVYGAAVSEVEVNTLTGETRILAADVIVDSGRSMNPAIDIGQIEGAFVQGIGFFMTENILLDPKHKNLSDGTWTYKPPTIDTIPRRFSVELFDSPPIKYRVLSAKGVGEPPLLLAGSVSSAIRHAIISARKDYFEENVGQDNFQFNPPATMERIKSLCGFDNVERYLQSALKNN